MRRPSSRPPGPGFSIPPNAVPAVLAMLERADADLRLSGKLVRLCTQRHRELDEEPIPPSSGKGEGATVADAPASKLRRLPPCS